jgi:thymidylate synthase
MRPYLDLLRHVLDHGERRTDRTGTGTISVFGAQARYDLRAGFPLVTTKKVLFPAVVRELLWFLRGSTNIHDDLTQHTPIWDAWADASGELGPIYGHQWRSWGGRGSAPGPGAGAQPSAGEGIDQISEAIATIKRDPTSRRIIVSAWNVAALPEMALLPCHALFQFYVAPASGGRRARLSCQLYQRSADIFLGVPFNIASYALLTHMLAQQCDLDVGDFIWTGGDCHIYSNHAEQVELQLARAPYPYPVLELARRPDSIFDYRQEDFVVHDYRHHAPIKAPVAV